MLCLSVAARGGAAGQQQPQPPSQRGVERIADAKAGARVGNRWALIVGVDQYADKAITPLSGAVADARAIRDALIAYADFPESQAFLLVSDGAREADQRGDLRQA